jgi:hypothetical protein
MFPIVLGGVPVASDQAVISGVAALDGKHLTARVAGQLGAITSTRAACLRRQPLAADRVAQRDWAT